MPFPPDSCARYAQYAGDSYAEQMPSCQQCYIGEGAREMHGEGDSVGGEDRRERGGDDGEDGEDYNDEVASPERPIL